MAAVPTSIARASGIWALYAAGFVPALAWFYLGATGQIPGNAVKTFEHVLGIWALRYLIAALCITPLRDLTGIRLLHYRRALGLLAFWYALMHFATYAVLDQRLDLAAILRDIAVRPFITIGTACLVLLIPLAVTSNGASIRRLGRNWNRLHKLSYLIVPGATLHFVLSVKVLTPEPLIYLAIALALAAYRPLARAVSSRRRPARIMADR